MHHHATSKHACKVCLTYHEHTHVGEPETLRCCAVCLRYHQHRFALARAFYAAQAPREAEEYRHG
jgi:hypothetical protein